MLEVDTGPMGNDIAVLAFSPVFSRVGEMIIMAHGCDGVVPVDDGKQPEPLFAVYRKSVAAPMREFFESGGRKISDLFGLGEIKYVEMSDARCYQNLNTLSDYETYPSKIKESTGPDGIGIDSFPGL